MPKIVQSFISVSCKQIQSFSNVDILNLIPPETLTKIKETDSNPLFQAYSICHEGNSTPTIIGEGPKPISWTKRAIQSLKNIVTKGVKFFLGHNEDNSTEGRQELGEVVADTQQEIDGVLHHIVIGYFPDREKVIDTDICSQEADWDLFETAKNYIADKINELTGIALGDSDYEKPAFKGARRLGMIQAFESGVESINKKKGVQDMDLSTISFNELAGELKRRQLKPSQICSIDDIKSDREFKFVFDEIETLKTTILEKEDKIKTLEDDKTELGTQVQVSTASKRFDTLIGNQSAPLTEKQKTFIKTSFSKRLDINKINNVTDEGLQTFITDRLEDYKIDVESELINDDPVDTKPGDNINDDTKTKQVDKDDLTKKENNPLLKEDFEPG